MNYQQIPDELLILLYGCTDDVATTGGVNTSPAVAITQPDTSRGDNNTQYMSDNNIGQLKRPPEQLIKEREDEEQLRLAIELSMQEDYKDSDMIAEPKNVASASKNGGDNSNKAFAFLPPESGAKSQVDIKTGSKSNTKNDIFRFGPARRNNSSTADGIVGDVGKLSVAVTQPEHTDTGTSSRPDTDTVITQNTTSSYNSNRELVNIRRNIRRKEKDAIRKKKKRGDPAYAKKEAEAKMKKRHGDPEYTEKEKNDRKLRRDKNPQQEEKYANDKKEKRADIRNKHAMNRATFATTVGDMFKKDEDGKVQLNTIGYETIPNGELGPEVAAMNMHMASMNRLQEITMKLFLENPNEENRNHVLDIIEGQMITPERQHSKAIEFYHQIGRGCDWDDSNRKPQYIGEVVKRFYTKQYLTCPQDFDSDDAKNVRWLVKAARKGNIEIEKQIKELDEQNAEAIVRDALLKRAKQLEDNDELSIEYPSYLDHRHRFAHLK
jgi:hypothetical protein